MNIICKGKFLVKDFIEAGVEYFYIGLRDVTYSGQGDSNFKENYYSIASLLRKDYYSILTPYTIKKIREVADKSGVVEIQIYEDGRQDVVKLDAEILDKIYFSSEDSFGRKEIFFYRDNGFLDKKEVVFDKKTTDDIIFLLESTLSGSIEVQHQKGKDNLYIVNPLKRRHSYPENSYGFGIDDIRRKSKNSRAYYGLLK